MVWWTNPPGPAWKSICMLKCLPLKAFTFKTQLMSDGCLVQPGISLVQSPGFLQVFAACKTRGFSEVDGRKSEAYTGKKHKRVTVVFSLSMLKNIEATSATLLSHRVTFSLIL